jgi:hypothetical protein
MVMKLLYAALSAATVIELCKGCGGSIAVYSDEGGCGRKRFVLN